MYSRYYILEVIVDNSEGVIILHVREVQLLEILFYGVYL